MSLHTATRPAHAPTSRPVRRRRTAPWLLLGIVLVLTVLAMTVLVLLAGEQAAGGAEALVGQA